MKAAGSASPMPYNMPNTYPPRDPQRAGTESPTLPTPRALLTSLISSLPSAPSPTTPASTTTNPLHHAPPSVRSLLTTLHILFPTVLLPALDLLDRNLITRVTQTSPVAPTPHVVVPAAAPQPLPPQAPTIHPANDAAHQDPAAGAQSGAPGAERDALPGPQSTQNQIYLVRSSQASRSRSHAEKLYTVRLGAWNCNCAAFAFAAFPASLGSSLGVDYAEADDVPVLRWDTDRTGDGGGEEEGAEEWEFGGMSRDGVDGGGVPCCKHLLACVLAERWEGWLGGFVKERKVGTEEMAGLNCDG